MRPILAAAALLAATSPALSQGIPCGPTAAMLAKVAETGMKPVFRGMTAFPARGEAGVLAAGEDGHWIFIVIRGETACILAEGRSGQVAKRGRGV